MTTELNLNFLTNETLNTLFSAAITRLTENGPDFYGWKNRPTYDFKGWHDGDDTDDDGNLEQPIISPEKASAQVKAKLDGAYGERFLNLCGMIAALVNKGKRVAILQKQEKGLPFDADGWVIVCVEGYPLFHIAPWDLPMEKIADIVSVVNEGTPEYEWTEWKGTNKVSEYTMLLEWLAE